MKLLQDRVLAAAYRCFAATPAEAHAMFLDEGPTIGGGYRLIDIRFDPATRRATFQANDIIVEFDNA